MSLRIAMISEHASPVAAPGSIDSGGQNVYVAQLARYLTQMGHQVDVYTRRDQALPEIVPGPGNSRVFNVPAGPAHYIPKEKLLPYMKSFGQYMLQRMHDQPPYDIVHANFFMSGLVACRLQQAVGVPFVVTFHALGRVRLKHQRQTDQFPHERSSIEDVIVRRADRIIAECPQDEEDQIRMYGADPHKIRVVPCGFDETELWPVSKTRARAKLGLTSSEPLIAQIGRLVPRKGVDNAIRGFGRLVHRYGISARMMIVGGETKEPDPVRTPEIARLQAVAQQEGVLDRVWFAGQADRRSLKYFYSAADVFVTTPWYEPFGITPLEAMACGTPVIGSKVGGIKFSVRDGQTGFLVPPHNPDALAERLAQLCQQSELRRAFANESLDWVRSMFTWRHVSHRVASVYQEVLAEQAAADRRWQLPTVARLRQALHSVKVG